MPIDNYFDTPFASSGTRTIVPDALDPSGNVSYTQGYTIDYQLPVGNPSRKTIERDKFNDILFEITTALKQYQQNGIPPFITTTMNGGSPYSYMAGISVISGGVIYESLVDNNTTTPPSSSWEAGAGSYARQLTYPIGSIYINKSNPTNPATLFGFGTWVAITDKFIIGASGSYPAGTTGGATSAALSVSNIPPHQHATNVANADAYGVGTPPIPLTGGGDLASPTTNIPKLTSSVGSGTAFSILNPYVSCYVWERTA